ncbi:sensor histidine kinase [Tengunoibacter tsumagoiensis]|uniref:Histidine kinase domain-containing protein n=1 Tax=Tengunoibacter tsumagoiensis TaxID=2014871 RepID=A0A401ZWK0_9CHLR|nr:sensor histidine kinase [Tengunoibacter tsumagoiensis]GCE11237.1 hypothetical protein KTT_10960 [Tengunoibacter tsumagoiensis]
MVQRRRLRGITTQVQILLQLLLSFGVIYLIAIFIGRSHFYTGVALAYAAGLLITFTLPYQVSILELGLERLSQNLPLEPLSTRYRWPLHRLFVLLNSLVQQSNLPTPVARQTTQYRDQLIEQVGKTAAQEERNRLARDLHDTIKQQIFSIVVSAAAIRARWEHDPVGARRTVEDIERTALEAQVEMQALLQQLRPAALENVGLIESLRIQCQALGYRTGAEVSYELGILPAGDLLPLGAQEMIFRIVQECFANIARHARAEHVWLSLLQQDQHLLLEIGDDGQGFSLAEQQEGEKHGGMGLSNIRDRTLFLGGSVSFWSQPQQGTTVHLSLPLSKSVEVSDLEDIVADDKMQRLVKARERWLSVGQWIVEAGSALILLCLTPNVTVIFLVGALILALLVALRAHALRLPLDLQYRARQLYRLIPRFTETRLWAGCVLLTLLWIEAWIADHNYSKLGYNLQWLMTGWVVVTIFLIGLLLWLYWRAYRQQELYYRGLKIEVLEERLQGVRHRLSIDGLAWLCMAGLTIVFWVRSELFFLPGEEGGRWLSLGLVCLWLIGLINRGVHLVRGERILEQKEDLEYE